MTSGSQDHRDDIVPALRVTAVTKAYTTRPVLKGVDLELFAAQSVCVCGINGAGKSTLLKVIAGLLRADSGSVHISGVDMARDPEMSRARLGMISHASMTYPELTVSENLAFAADLYGVTDRAGRIDAILVHTGLGPYRHDRAAILSRGLLQRLAIGRALLHEPVLLLADEPFTGLDTGACENLVQIFHSFVQQGGSLVMTTHNTRLGLRCCDRVVVLDQGRVILNDQVSHLDQDRFVLDYVSYARTSRGGTL